jgi:hypothetical protein
LHSQLGHAHICRLLLLLSCKPSLIDYYLVSMHAHFSLEDSMFC